VVSFQLASFCDFRAPFCNSPPADDTVTTEFHSVTPELNSEMTYSNKQLLDAKGKATTTEEWS